MSEKGTTMKREGNENMKMRPLFDDKTTRKRRKKKRRKKMKESHISLRNFLKIKAIS